MFAHQDPDQLALPIHGKKSKLNRDHFEILAIKCGIKVTAIEEYVDEIEANIDSFYDTFCMFGAPEDFVMQLKSYCTSRIENLRN